MQIGVIDRYAQKVVVRIRQQLIDLVFFIAPLAPLIEQEYAYRQRQANDGHHIARKLPELDVINCRSDAAPPGR